MFTNVQDFMANVESKRRKLEIIREGLHSDFWKILKEEYSIMANEEAKNAASLLINGKKELAEKAAQFSATLNRIIEAPEVMLSQNSAISNFTYDVCSACGNLVRKIMQKEGEVHATSRFSE